MGLPKLPDRADHDRSPAPLPEQREAAGQGVVQGEGRVGRQMLKGNGLTLAAVGPLEALPEVDLSALAA